MLKNIILSRTYYFYSENIGEYAIFSEEQLGYMKTFQMSHNLTFKMLNLTFTKNIRNS